MHITLFSAHDPGMGSYLKKSKEECRLLGLVRHPNIVQYLATYQDPETHLPVLLVELCDESLTKFLEQFLGPHWAQHQPTLALVYLHYNSLIHRDLTGNNILMIAGTQAKVTDFGMSKLANVNPCLTSLTLCPGNVQYMSPEDLDESPVYTDKPDIFSYKSRSWPGSSPTPAIVSRSLTILDTQMRSEEQFLRLSIATTTFSWSKTLILWSQLPGQ